MFFHTVYQKLKSILENDSRLLHLIVIYLAIKGGLVLAALLGNQLLPFNWQLYNVNLVLDVQNLPNIFRAFNTWDTQHYLFLAQRGYGVNPMSNAFYPLYPFLIRIFTPVFFNHGLIAAWCIANLFSLLVPVYMYKLCCLFWTKDQAFKSTVILLAFPTAFFMSSAYTEALYLSICLMAFYYLFKKDVWKASVLCFLLPLVRAQALLFLLPIGVMFFQAIFSKKAALSENLKYACRFFLPPAFATMLGMFAYFAFCRWQLGGFLAGMNAQQLFVAKNSLGNLIELPHWFINNFVNIHLSLHSYTTSIIDRSAFILCAPFLIGIYRTQNKALFAYAAANLLVPALAGSFMSYTRFLLAVFPLFIYVGTRFKRPEFAAIPMFALQVLFYLLHTGGYWFA
jgi:Mannosyltransferase (PIG-V)